MFVTILNFEDIHLILLPQVGYETHLQIINLLLIKSFNFPYFNS